MSDFGLRIGIEGERDFKAALRDINQAFKVLGSEMALVTSQFEKNDRSAQSLTSRNAVLTKEIDQQRDKVSTLRSALDNAAASFGENDKRTQNWQIQLNKAQAELNHMERELRDNNTALAGFAKESRAAGDAQGDVATGTKRAHASFADLGGLLKGNVTQSITDVKTGMVDTARNVVDGAREMGGSIVQFAKETVTGENNVKALGDALRDKLEARLRGTAGETDDLSKSLDNAGDELSGTGKETKNLGDELDGTGKKASVFGDVLKASLAADAIKAGLGAIVDGVKAVAGAIFDFVGNNIIKGGFDRALKLEQASFKLQGLGHDAKSVARILDEDVTNAVKGTAYGLDAMSGVAASALAAGIPQGKELERTLTLVADAAAISGRGVEDMGAIFNKIATAGKISGQEINQLSNAGIPIMQLLADTTGHSIDQVKKLVSDGKIGMEKFQAAIEKGMGGAAKTMGQTWQGSVDNMNASMSRLGAKIVGSFTDDLKPAIHGITALFDFVKDGSNLTGDEIQAKIVGIANDVKTSIEGLIKNVGPILDRAIPIVMSLLDEIVKIIPGLLQKIIPVVINLIDSLSSMLPGLLDTILPVLIDGVLQLATGIVRALPAFVEAAVKMVEALILGLTAALPELIPVAIEAILLIVQSLIDNLPMLLDAALQLILGLTEGLLAALPELIAALPAIIVGIVGFLIEAIPQIIEAGIQLLMGIIGALPEIIAAIVEALPQIIEGVVGGLLGALPELIGAGWQLLKGLLEGIVKAVPELLKGIRDVCKSLIQAFLGIFGIKSPSTVFADMGSNLLRGLWQGIQNMKDWLVNKIRGLGSLITGALKSVLGISSPSRVFRDQIGANLAFGLGEGFTSAMRRVTRDMQNAVPTDFDVDANLNADIHRHGAGAAGGGSGGFSLTLHIEHFHNNTAQDLRQLADELSTLMADGIRRKGAATA